MKISVDEASKQNGVYPRPQLVRDFWTNLDGTWMFHHDDNEVGCSEQWWNNWPDSAREIAVPFAPETRASGIDDRGYHQVIWYRRILTTEELELCQMTVGRRLLLHFGAVDFRAQVWLDGQYLGSHEGGHTPFTFDVTDALNASETHTITVRAEDDPLDLSQPRGKQDWQVDPHAVWYDRTSGIWQSVWMESVPSVYLTEIRWTPNLEQQCVRIEATLSAQTVSKTAVHLTLACDGQEIASLKLHTTGKNIAATIPLEGLQNGQDRNHLIWTPEHPNLIDATIEVGEDRVGSYFGIRSCEVAGGHFLLNGYPYYLRSVLSQGFWPDSHLTAPCPEALKDEVLAIKNLGFNSARLHQKFEDPRFLYWADRLGLLVWGEAPACYDFTPIAVERTTREWLEVLRRDYSHPCIVAWVPLNESWGVHEIRQSTAMQSYARALVNLTKALDSTRPVVSNDGWEQIDTDIIAIHDYEASGTVLAERYGSLKAIEAMIMGFGPAGRKLILSSTREDAPIMLTEFGGVSFDLSDEGNSWGYSTADSPEDFQKRLETIMQSIHNSPVLAGFCYTQLTDTMQETNGLLTAERQPKLPLPVLRKIVTGETR